jgi:molybdate transport system substrate-binding protein
MTVWLISALLGFYFSLITLAANAESVTVAVASNFTATVYDLVTRFEAESGHSVRVSSASTGVLYAQITNGAPFDVLLAADAERPRLLETSGHGVSGSRFTYAIGHLVLWSRDPALTEGDCREQLENLGQQRLAIANPDTAPYGAAARDALMDLNLWERVQPQLVVGRNIAQTLQYVASGNASLGFIAGNQTLDERLPEATCSWRVPPEMHRAIEQQAILLRRAADNTVASEFLSFLRNAAGRAIIEQSGYTIPDAVVP